MGELTRSFTDPIRNEPGNLRFDWSRSADDPNEFVLFETPKIISQIVDQDDWGTMGEPTVSS
ncbi:MAG: antibiotic biosynthesis monooxygenase [Propionibacteriales bacterium]|nr:antibiotic biosynthesis monooxygenase [Propionibacteriales bacterium]